MSTTDVNEEDCDKAETYNQSIDGRENVLPLLDGLHRTADKQDS